MIKKLKNSTRQQQAVITLTAALVLATLLYIAQAAGPFASFEAEGGLLNNAVIKNSTAASNGQYVEYSGLPPPPPTSFSCTRMLAMSQGRQTFEGLMATGKVPSGTWEAEITGGATLIKWVDRNFEGYNGNMVARCSGNQQPDRITFLFDPLHSDWPTDMHTVLGNIRFHHPQVKQIVLILLVGAENNAVCQSPTEPSKNVRASTTHKAFDGTLEEIADDYGDVIVGPDLEIPCSQYGDTVGHLTESGKATVGAQMAEWLNL